MYCNILSCHPYGGLAILIRRKKRPICDFIFYDDTRIMGIQIKNRDECLYFVNVYLPYQCPDNYDLYVECFNLFIILSDLCILDKLPSSDHLTLSDPGYFRQLTIRGGGFNIPPYDLENYRVNLHHIIYVNFTRCFWHDPIGIFKKFAILTILQRFQNKK